MSQEDLAVNARDQEHDKEESEEEIASNPATPPASGQPVTNVESSQPAFESFVSDSADVFLPMPTTSAGY